MSIINSDSFRIKAGTGILVAGGGVAGAVLIGAGSAFFAIPVVGIAIGTALIVLGAYLYWKERAGQAPSLSDRRVEKAPHQTPEKQRISEAPAQASPWWKIAAAAASLGALLYAFGGRSAPSNPGNPASAGSSLAVIDPGQCPVPETANWPALQEFCKAPRGDVFRNQLTLPQSFQANQSPGRLLPSNPGGLAHPASLALIPAGMDLSQCPVPETGNLPALQEFCNAPQRSLFRNQLTLSQSRPANQPAGLLPAPEKLAQLVSLREFFRILEGNRRLSLMALPKTDFSIMRDQISSELTLPTVSVPPASLNASGSIVRTVAGDDFRLQAKEANIPTLSWTHAIVATAAGAALWTFSRFKEWGDRIKEFKDRFQPTRRPPFDPWRTGKGAHPFGSGSSGISMTAPIRRDIRLPLHSLMPARQELEPGLQAALDESLRASRQAGTWVPLDRFVQDVRAARMDPEPFLRHCRRQGDWINADDVHTIPFENLRLLYPDDPDIQSILRETEELEERAGEEDFERRMEAARRARSEEGTWVPEDEMRRNIESLRMDPAPFIANMRRQGSFVNADDLDLTPIETVRFMNSDDALLRRQLQELEELEEQAEEEDLRRAIEKSRKEERRSQRRIGALISQMQPGLPAHPQIQARL